MLLNQGAREGVFPGAVLLVGVNGKQVFKEVTGYASIIPERKKITFSTCFDIASLTKVVAVTSAIMLFVQKGILTLDTPLYSFLPGFKKGEKKGITLRYLLCHAAGFEDWRPYYRGLVEEERKSGVLIRGTSAAKEYFLEMLKEEKLVYAPGAGTRYSDLDFLLLGFIIETVCGEGIDRFCDRNIFSPLGMGSTFFIKHFGIKKRAHRLFAATERCPWRESVLEGEVHDENAWVLGGVAGHAGLFSTAADLFKFSAEMIDSYYGNGKLFKKETAREFFLKQDMVKGSTWALGWDTPTPEGSTSGRYFSEESIGHTGFTGSSLWIDLKRRCAVILLTNRIHPSRTNTGIRRFRPEIHDRVMEALGFGG